MRTRHLIASCLAALSLAAAGCGNDEEGDEDAPDSTAEPQQPNPEAPPATSGASTREKPKIAKPKGEPPKELVAKDLVKGKGATAKAGSRLTVNYVGVNYSDGKEFDSSFGREPFDFELGASMVIPGWDEGLEGMRVGGRRQLTIPPDKAYGPQGSPPAIGPNETLVFVIDLLAVK